MTIIKPTQRYAYLRFFILLVVVLLVGGGGYIFEYSALADLRHRLETASGQLEEAKVANADLKELLYQRIDPTSLERLAKDRGLLLERRPEYLSRHQWLSVSSH